MKPGFVISSLIAALFATPSFAEPTELDKKTVASKAYVDSEIATLAAHTVNGMPLSSPEITFYGTSSTEAATAVKDVYLVDSNGTAIQNADFSGNGRVLIVIPSVTASQASTIKIGGDTNNQGLIYYHGSQADNSVASKIWVAGRPSVFVKNNSGWHFVAGGAEVVDTLSWNNTFPAAINAYSTIFDSTSTHTNGNWPYQGEDKLVNGTTLANALSLKQNKIAAFGGQTFPEFFDGGWQPDYTFVVSPVDEDGVAYSNIFGVLDTSLADTGVVLGDRYSALGNLNDDFLAAHYEDLNMASAYAAKDLANSLVPTALLVGNALYGKQNKIGATSDGTDNTPNYVYNANTNQYAAGSVVTTTTTAGTTGQVGIATAPTRDNNGDLTNGDWIPTMSAIDSMVSGVDLSSHKVNGQPLSNAQITFYGSSETEVSARKAVTLYDYSDPSNPTPITIPELVKGMVIVVKPDHTASTLLTIMITNVSDDRGHTARYGSSGITMAMAPKVWNETAPSVWVYDGTYWNFVGGGKEAIPTIYWQSQETAATNAYSTTFDGTEGNWPVGDENAFVDGTALAQGLSLKQNKITPSTVTFLTGTEAEDSGLGIVTANLTATGLTGSDFGVLTGGHLDLLLNFVDSSAAPFVYGLNYANDDFFTNTTGLNPVELEKFVPTIGAVGNALHEIDLLKQNKIPARANGEPTKIVTYPAYGSAAGAIGELSVDTSTLNTANDTSVPSSKLVSTSLDGKQNKLPAGTYGANNSVVTYDSTAGSVQERWVLGAGVAEVEDATLLYSANMYKGVLFNYDQTTGHMASNNFGTLYDEDDNEIAITQDEAENSLVPARYIAAALSYKQNILPGAWTSTNAPTTMGSQGGQTIEMDSTIGAVKRRYITAGGSTPLTLKSGSGVDNVMLYVNGTKSVSEFQTSNFGATGDAATANENYIKGALVSLELLKDVYSALHTEIQNATPTGTPNTLANYGANGALGNGVATADSVVVGANGSVTNGTSIATVTAVSTRQKKLTCGGYESGHSASDPDAMDYCWLWLLAEDEAPAQP